MLLIFFTFFVFHFDISGKDINDEQPRKIPLMSFTLSVFQFDISGKDSIDEHPKKIPCNFLILIKLEI